MSALHEHIMAKVFSGRWLATITACGVWILLTLQGVPSSEVQVGLLTLVLNSYFQRRMVEKDTP